MGASTSFWARAARFEPNLNVTESWKIASWKQGVHYESTYNVNYKGEVGTWYLGFREKNNFYCPVSDKSSENCH